jgi:hypothetical protein
MSDTLIKVDAVYGMWQGERICEIMGYTQEMNHVWTTDTMLDYFDKVLECYDLFRSTNGYVSESFDEIEPLKTETGSNFNPLKHWKHIRDSVIDYCVQFPEREPLEIIKKLGITVEQFQCAVSVNKNKTTMSETGFLSFSYACLQNSPNFAKIGRDYGTGVNTMVFYKKMFRAIKLARTEKMIDSGKI